MRLADRLLADRRVGALNDTFRRYQAGAFQKGIIPAYWYRTPNFGDAMAPLVFRAASNRRAKWVTKRFSGKVVLQGSVIGWALAPRDLVWGAGLQKPVQTAVPKGVTFLAVRGPLTRKFVAADVPDLFCDPGILVSMLYERSQTTTHSVGIVPHYVDLPHIRSDDPQVLIIDPLRPVREVVRMITSCEVVLSSSLHGIIVAEAFGIPAAWITVGDRLIGGDFKFRDYYLGTERDPERPAEWSMGIAAAAAQVREPGTYRADELRCVLSSAITRLSIAVE